MTINIESIKSKSPRILSAFDAKDSGYESIGMENDDDCFCLKNVQCKCGNSNLSVFTTITKENKKGLFKDKETIAHLAPVHLQCPSCKSENLLFDPRVHGWDGENGDCASATGENGQLLFNESPAKVYVEVSYQGEENYEDLDEDGILNLEDYFDTFNLYILPEGKSEAEEVLVYECA